MKGRIEPPVVGAPIEYPEGWDTDFYRRRIKEIEKKLGYNIVRGVFVLKGTEWDLTIICYVNSLDEYIDFCISSC